ncbi:MAG TPA: hypothetical protein VGD69_06450 [Herpetosiphonaceae bacterium]
MKLFFKRLGWCAAALILCAGISLWFLRVFGFRHPAFAMLVNWMCMTWMVVAGQLIDFALPSGYYRIHAFERSGRVYERVGIRRFKRLMLREPLSRLNPALRLSHDRTFSALRQLDHEMRKAETSHVYILIFMLSLTGYALLRQWLDAASWLLAFNLLLNGYPIILQRYNRARLQVFIERSMR